ncbi:TniB family NTP-binding protein [Phaeacidiphilus oryzae]|uniref:TniB family NTP-binding protein n=1 Tax=Phaeacidiphilus oryzae TaxID=348818 RepID=UPI0005665A83|nr:TniB family NTP-binding protein [Phaeacidiphilus oryzae]
MSAPKAGDPLVGWLSRERIAEIVLRPKPHRDTFDGWQHYRLTRGELVPPPLLTPRQWATLSEDRRFDYDIFRRLTNVNLPLQQTPMAAKVTRLIKRRLLGNALKQDDPTLAGVMVSGFGHYGKTATVSAVCAAFEDSWLQLHDYLNPTAVPGTADLHAPVVYVSTPVTATPKSVCQAILRFFRADMRTSATLPRLVQLVADSLRDHGVRALVLDDISRLRMHRADDQDVLDLIRAFMSLNVTLILTGVNIPGTGLLREAKWNAKQRHWVLPPLESARVHGLEVTQTEHRFELVEMDRFRYSTSEQINDFLRHLHGIEVHLRLLKAKSGMLTGGTMPEYLMRRTNGVVGLLGRLIEDGCQEAMDSGRERLDEKLLDEIVIRRDDPDLTQDEIEPQTPPTSTPRPARGRRHRNTVFDDHGPAAADAAG